MNKRLWIKTAQEAYEVQAQEAILAECKRELLDKLKLLSGNKSTSAGDFVFVVSMRKGSVDYNAIPELKAIDLGQYRKQEVATWKLVKVNQ